MKPDQMGGEENTAFKQHKLDENKPNVNRGCENGGLK